MKHILYTLAIIYAAWLSFPFLTAARERGISLSLTEASVGDDDSVTIRLHIVLTDIRVPTSRTAGRGCERTETGTLRRTGTGRRPGNGNSRQQLLLPSRSPQKEQQP